MENQNKFFGIVVSRDILESRELSAGEKLVYSYIASFQRCCYESNARIADKLGLSESSVAHAMPKLMAMGLIFVVKSNNNSRARVVYDVKNNAKKLAYLERKYKPKGCGKPVENSKGPMQNLHLPMQNLHSQKTGVESAKFADKEKEYNKNTMKTNKNRTYTPAGLAGFGPASRLAVKRRDFGSEIDFERAFYEFRTVCLGEN